VPRAFQVVRPDELQGEHWFDLEPAEAATVLHHTIKGSASGRYEAIWRERIEPLHDRILEALLDNIEVTAASSDRGRPAPLQKHHRPIFTYFSAAQVARWRPDCRPGGRSVICCRPIAPCRPRSSADGVVLAVSRIWGPPWWPGAARLLHRAH
jgi:hypothetical protein